MTSNKERAPRDPPTVRSVDRSGPPRRRASKDRFTTVYEVSAGGMVIDGLADLTASVRVALIGRPSRNGTTIWSLPKGHIERGERAEEAAVREVREETGIISDVLAALGTHDYWFLAGNRRVHKTVHHYLLQFAGGKLNADDHEVTEVAWLPLDDLSRCLAYPDERRLVPVAAELIDIVRTTGTSGLPPLPPSAPRRRGQTHSRSV